MINVFIDASFVFGDLRLRFKVSRGNVLLRAQGLALRIE